MCKLMLVLAMCNEEESTACLYVYLKSYEIDVVRCSCAIRRSC